MSVIDLALPLIDQKKIKILLNADSIITKEHCFDKDLLDTRWYKMEEDLITEVRGTPPLIFKPTFAFYGSNDMIKQSLYENGKTIFILKIGNIYYIYLFMCNIFVLTELVQVQMTLSNPLNISLSLENLSLTYSFDNDSTLVEPQLLDELLLASSSTTQVIYSCQ